MSYIYKSEDSIINSIKSFMMLTIMSQLEDFLFKNIKNA